MRWRNRERHEKRYRYGFLLFPKKISGETRWLERAAWIETWYAGGWVGIRWLEIQPATRPPEDTER